MDKRELSNLIDRISLTGPGGIEKVKRVLKEIAESGDVTEEELQEALAEKQDILVSGENIKTINGQPVLGEGDIVIPQGETGPQGPAGPQGPEGPQGIQGNTGSSVDYPYELVNNRTTNDATKGLSAAEGYRMGQDISQLEAEVGDLDELETTDKTSLVAAINEAAQTSGGSNLTGYVSVDSVQNLPDPGQATLGYLVGTDLYLYVGTGGDTLGGKYQNCGPFRGPAGQDGQDGQDGAPGQNGVGFASVSTPSTPDGTVTITLTNGDTITLSLSHDHPQYLKYVMLTDESEMPANPDPTTFYMWPEAQS